MARPTVLLVVAAVTVMVGCGDGGGASGVEAFCTEASSVDAQLRDVESALEGLPSSKTLDRIATAVGDVAADAPSEIEGDIETVAESLELFADTFSGVDLSDPNALRDPALLARLEQSRSELERAGAAAEESIERVGRYLEAECGFDVLADE